jgi:high frequency lysogenization protein
MSDNNIDQETEALAALFLCCAQIQRIATTGFMDDNAAACVIRSILVTNPGTIDDIYDNAQLRTGYQALADCLGRTSLRSLECVEVTKSAFKVMELENQLERSGKFFDELGAKIDSLHSSISSECPGFLDGNVSDVLDRRYIKMFADTYSSIISPHFSKLIICGQEECLRREENQERIRALLLAAVRAVVLWRQLGGKRRFLVFRRGAIVKCAQSHL